MGIPREQFNKKFKSLSLLETPGWLRQADDLPNRLYVTRAENELLDLIRAGGEVTKADLVSLTEYSRTKITGCIDSLLARKYIIENEAKEYSGGRRSRTFSINGGLALVAGVDIGATSIDFAVADLNSENPDPLQRTCVGARRTPENPRTCLHLAGKNDSRKRPASR